MINRKRKFLALLMVLTMVTLPAVMVTPAAAQSTGVVTAIMQVIPGVGTFTGVLTTTSLSLVNGVINLVGTITGTITNSVGAVLLTVASLPVTIPLLGFTGTCSILTLHTGAIALSVLGLNIALSPIDLIITATAAEGNLLGNLLCAVVHLLDSNGPLSTLTNLLNQILPAAASVVRAVEHEH